MTVGDLSLTWACQTRKDSTAQYSTYKISIIYRCRKTAHHVQNHEYVIIPESVTNAMVEAADVVGRCDGGKMAFVSGGRA